jgi:heptosyltransferase-2
MHYNLFSLLTLAPKRVGHTYLRMNTSQLNWLKNYTITENDALHCVEENVALLSLLGIDFAGVPVPPLSIYLDESEIAGGKAFRNTFGGRPVIGVHAGTSVFKGHAARRWPKERFAEVIRNFPDAHFLLFGTSEEEEANRFILGNVSGNATLVTDKTIRQVGAIIKSCDFFISNDSGLMHLAAAVRTPVIAVIGPTNPVYIHPWGVEHAVIMAPTPCRHCFRYSPKPLACTNSVPFECLLNLPVDKVIETTREYIGKFGFLGQGA